MPLATSANRKNDNTNKQIKSVYINDIISTQERKNLRISLAHAINLAPMK